MPLAGRDGPGVGIVGVRVVAMDRAGARPDERAEQEANDALDVAREVAVRPAVVDSGFHLGSHKRLCRPHRTPEHERRPEAPFARLGEPGWEIRS